MTREKNAALHEHSRGGRERGGGKGSAVTLTLSHLLG